MRLRDQADAVLVGAGTVRADDPRLTVRMRGGRDPLRVILDGRLTTSPRARVAAAGTLFACTRDAQRAAEARLRRTGAEVVRLAGRGGRVTPGALLDELGRRGVHELLVEGGSDLHGQLLAARLVDRLVVFVAPLLLGASALPLAGLPGGATVAEALRLRAVSTKQLGDDIMVVGFLDGPGHRRTWLGAAK
jgi:diaminohydroxyphosphoribosylaminopyrimidine deaminase/5-amino-6-(5-phosphoribosylamino)uracil reductase